MWKLLILFITISVHAKPDVVLHKLEDYTHCQEQGISGFFCHEALKEWVKSHPTDAFKAGKLTRLYMNHWLAIPFFKKSTIQSDFNCKDNDLKLAVLGGLNLPRTGNEKIIDAADQIAFEICAKQMKADVTEAAALDTNLFINTCKKLELKGIKKSKCQML